MMPPTGKFAIEMAAMMGGSLLLFNTLLRQGGRDLARMILIGVIFRRVTSAASPPCSNA